MSTTISIVWITRLRSNLTKHSKFFVFYFFFSLNKNFKNFKNFNLVFFILKRFDGSSRQSVFVFNLNSKYRNELFQDQEVVDKTFAGDQMRTIEARTSVIYADYQNIIVFFTCFESRHYIMPMVNVFFHVFVRDPAFDSLGRLRQALGPLQKLGVNLNEFGDLYDLRGCVLKKLD